MLAKTILAEATHGNQLLGEAIVAEPDPVETILAAAIAHGRYPLS